MNQINKMNQMDPIKRNRIIVKLDTLLDRSFNENNPYQKLILYEELFQTMIQNLWVFHDYEKLHQVILSKLLEFKSIYDSSLKEEQDQWLIDFFHKYYQSFLDKRNYIQNDFSCYQQIFCDSNNREPEEKEDNGTECIVFHTNEESFFEPLPPLPSMTCEEIETNENILNNQEYWDLNQISVENQRIETKSKLIKKPSKKEKQEPVKRYNLRKRK